ncbi:putative holliday junction resolvase [Salmonella phage GEC_vB_N6]|nr:putative holliday junction resolvase [Salmonella phage GEC_vB_GOT]QPI15275.1 putative holliday junction resolvase [Salmonella phage GEC_vB_N6]
MNMLKNGIMNWRTIMPNVERADIQQVQDVILQRLRAVITNEKGEIAPGFEGAFDGFVADDQGNPVVQTIAGMIMLNSEFMADGKIHYSPNLSVDGESLASEVVDLTVAVGELGYVLMVCTAHYVDANGHVSYGDEARGIKRHVDTAAVLQQIRQMQEEMDSKPRLILPDSKIVTR